MIKTVYTQPQISFSKQLALLKNEGLKFGDEAKAAHLLRNISLFRMKNYLKLLRIPGKKDFKPGATFEQAYSYYKFDSELRKLICAELEKIEVSIRTLLSYTMSDTSGIYWFIDSRNFRNPSAHSALISKLQQELKRSDDDAITAFAKKYSNPFPPSWMAMEITSFGTLSMLYRYLCSGHGRRNVAGFYGLSDTVFESWMHSLVYVRNICAHHSCLWNRTLRISPLIPRKTKSPFLTNHCSNSHIYFILCIILYLLKAVNPHNTLPKRFREFIAKYPNVDTASMGFPTDWSTEPLWAV
ncbi:MAG: Abi family protein [Muribaculaceae bacterium]|nr:Abi family protein [Muribaculaceae bacterium]